MTVRLNTGAPGLLSFMSAQKYLRARTGSALQDRIGQRRFGAAHEHDERLGIDIVEAAALLVLLRVGGTEQTIVQAHLAFDAFGSWRSGSRL